MRAMARFGVEKGLEMSPTARAHSMRSPGFRSEEDARRRANKGCDSDKSVSCI